MSKQEEIKEGIEGLLRDNFDCRCVGVDEKGDICQVEQLDTSGTTLILNYLHSQGVVIKVDREPSTYFKEDGEQKYYSDMPYEMYEDGWRRFKPLIEEV